MSATPAASAALAELVEEGVGDELQALLDQLVVDLALALDLVGGLKLGGKAGLELAEAHVVEARGVDVVAGDAAVGSLTQLDRPIDGPVGVLRVVDGTKIFPVHRHLGRVESGRAHMGLRRDQRSSCRAEVRQRSTYRHSRSAEAIPKAYGAPCPRGGNDPDRAARSRVKKLTPARSDSLASHTVIASTGQSSQARSNRSRSTVPAETNTAIVSSSSVKRLRRLGNTVAEAHAQRAVDANAERVDHHDRSRRASHPLEAELSPRAIHHLGRDLHDATVLRVVGVDLFTMPRTKLGTLANRSCASDDHVTPCCSAPAA